MANTIANWLLGFGITHFRSFGDPGFFMAGPFHINVLIGKNNSGKSNALRVIQLFSSMTSGGSIDSKLLDGIANTYRHSKGNARICCSLNIEALSLLKDRFSMSQLQLIKATGRSTVTITWNAAAGNHIDDSLLLAISKKQLWQIAEGIDSDDEDSEVIDSTQAKAVEPQSVEPQSVGSQSAESLPDERPLGNIGALLDSEYGHSTRANIFETDFEIPPIDSFEPRKKYDADSFDAKAAASEIGGELVGLAARIIRLVFGRLVIVPVFRAIRPESDRVIRNKMFDGIGVVERLREMQHPPLGEERLRVTFDRIRHFVRHLLNSPSLELEVPTTGSELLVNMNGIRLSLDNFGTGVHHLILLAAMLAQHDDTVVTIEEPETHLHPELQRKLLYFISNSTNNAYYISTHSSVFLDAPSGAVIYHVTHNGSATSVTQVLTPPAARVVLADMGYKASDLLQSNCVLWVEGPSDRLYLNRWISLVASDLVEGIHYAVAFYGGKVLAHFTTADDPSEDLVQVLRINKHALVVMDRDGDDETALLNRSKERILAELGPDACWVSRGREVENYLPLLLIRRTLIDQYPAVAQVQFSSNDSLDEILMAMEGGPSRFDKVPFARRICAVMSVEDLDVLDLRERLATVVRLIRHWNHSDEPVSWSPA